MAIAKACHEKKESLSRIAIIGIPIIIAILAASMRIVGKNEKVSIVDISPVILSMAGRYSGLSKAEIL